MLLSRSPAFVEPMTTIKRLGVAGDQWLCEVKLDGYGALLLRNGGHVQIRSRKSNDLTATYPHVVAAALALNAQSAVLDGEIVALDKQGRPSFQAIQHRASERTPPSTTASTSCTSTARI
jgi:bifunctional non-homologous end joining protein LigD